MAGAQSEVVRRQLAAEQPQQDRDHPGKHDQRAEHDPGKAEHDGADPAQHVGDARVARERRNR